MDWTRKKRRIYTTGDEVYERRCSVELIYMHFNAQGRGLTSPAYKVNGLRDLGEVSG